MSDESKLLTPAAYRAVLMRFLGRGGKFEKGFDLEAAVERHRLLYEDQLAARSVSEGARPDD